MARGMDVGTAVGLQATAVGLGIGALLAAGHAAAMDAVHADRAAREWAAYEGGLHDQIAWLQGRVEELEAELEVQRERGDMWFDAALKAVK